MTGSSERIFWYLFNGFLHVENSVVELFPPAKTSVDLPWEEVVIPSRRLVPHPPEKEMDPDEHLYQVGVGTIHPRHNLTPAAPLFV